MPEAGGEGEQALGDAGDQAGHGVGAVSFERELAFDGVEDRFDPIGGCRRGCRSGRGSSFRSGRRKIAPSSRHQRFELFAGEAFVGDHGVAVEFDAGEHLGGDLAFGGVGGRELERDRHAVGGAEQVEPEAPEVAAVACAVAIGGVAGESGALDGLAGGADGTGVESSSLILSYQDGEENATTFKSRTICGANAPHPLVVARLLGKVGEQMAEPAHREAQEVPLARDVEQDLRDRQADQLGVGDLWASPRTRPARQDFISQHVKCDQEGVEIGGHAATSMVDVGNSNADLRHPSYGPSAHNPPAAERNHSSRPYGG